MGQTSSRVGVRLSSALWKIVWGKTHIISDIPFPDLISQESLGNRLPISIVFLSNSELINSFECLVGVGWAVREGFPLSLLNTVMGVGMGMSGGDPGYQEREKGDKCACAHDG